MLLSKALLSVGAIASDDDARPLLQHIKVDRENGKVTAVATDSYILAEVIQETPDPLEFPKIGNDENQPIEHALIDATVALAASKGIPRKVVLPILNYALVEKNAISTTNLDTSTRHSYRDIEGKYPDYKKLIPAPADFSVNLNPKYLIAACKLFDEHEGMSIEFGKTKMDPVVLRSNSAGVQKTVLVMPLRA